ncbi:MAG: hypothetical protein ACTHKJ_03340 [Candidatus Nitrosocosmicus sp.]
MFNKPLEFVKNIQNGEHVVIFYEDAEYAQMILFKYLEKGLLNGEQCFLISTKQDKEFIKRDLQESISKVTTDNIIDVDKKINENLLFIGNLNDLNNYPFGIENAAKDIIEIVKVFSYTIYSLSGLETQMTKKIALRCLHKIENREQIQNNIKWEKNCRNTLLRNSLSNCSIICTYPIRDILSTIKGESYAYSEWMADLLEIYDAVIYARKYWKGAAFKLK